MRKLMFFLTAFAMAVAANAEVKVTESPAGTVTIEVVGVAGQIGREIDNYGNKSYEYETFISSEAQTLIKNAQNVIIKGNIDGDDIKALVAENAVNINGQQNWKLNNLDMGGAFIDKIEDEGNEWYTSKHTFLPDGNTRIACKSMTLPVTQDHIIPHYFDACFGPSSNKAVESIIIPEGYTVIDNTAFAYLPNLSSVTLPNTLTTINDEVFVQCPKLKVIVFPESLRTLGNNVFRNTHLLDVYFLGKEAPTVGNSAFDEGTYKGNGGMVDTSPTTPYGDTSNGYAERLNFINSANTFGVMHLRADLNNDERAKFTDITRDYRVEKGDDTKYKAFYDLYYGKDFIWPGRVSYEQMFNNAANGVLWNGTTTYDKDKYMGLHKFTVVASNVHNTDTKKWTFGKISADQWWTICVPFKMTKAQVREVFGDGTEVCMFSKVTRDEVNTQILLEFKDDRMAAAANDDDMVIQENISYMIFPTKQLSAGDKYVFDGYKMETGSPMATSIHPVFIPAASGDADYTYRFIGTYLSHWTIDENNGVGHPVVMPQYSYFLGAKDGKHKFFYQTGTNGKWNPFTSIVQVFDGQKKVGIDDDFVVAGGAKLTSLFGSEMGTTGIGTVSVELGNGKNATTVVYNLNGQAVRQGTDSLEGLPGGIYIVNGRKVVNK